MTYLFSNYVKCLYTLIIFISKNKNNIFLFMKTGKTFFILNRILIVFVTFKQNILLVTPN